MVWKQTVKQKDNLWWQVGTNKKNPLWLPKKWVNVEKSSYSGEWEVRAPTRINKQTTLGTSKFFKTRTGAIRFAKKYRK